MDLPGVQAFYTDGGISENYNTSLPRIVVFGTSSKDSHNGERIMFNEPYVIYDSEQLASYFDGALLEAITNTRLGFGSNVNVATIVGVRLGKPNVPTTYTAKKNATDTEYTGVSVTGTYTGKWNGDIRIYLVDGIYKVSIDEGRSYIEEYSTAKLATGSTVIDIYAFGLKATITDAAVFAQGDYAKIAVKYADVPSTTADYKAALTEAFLSLGAVSPSYAVFMEKPADEATGDTDAYIGYTFAKLLEGLSTNYGSVVGFMTVKKPVSITSTGIATWKSSLVTFGNTGFYKTGDGTYAGSRVSDELGVEIDLGKHVVVSGLFSSDGRTLKSMAGYLCGLAASRTPGSGSLLIEIPSSARFRSAFALSETDITDLLAAGIIVPRVAGGTATGPVYEIPDFRTFADEASSYSRYDSVAVANYCVDGARTIAKRYIGKPNSLAMRESMKNEIQKFLNEAAADGKFAFGVADVKVTEAGGTVGQVEVNMTIRAYMEIRAVRIKAVYGKIAA